MTGRARVWVPEPRLGPLTPCLGSIPLCLLPSHSAECDWTTLSTGLKGKGGLLRAFCPMLCVCAHQCVHVCMVHTCVILWAAVLEERVSKPCTPGSVWRLHPGGVSQRALR